MSFVVVHACVFTYRLGLCFLVVVLDAWIPCYLIAAILMADDWLLRTGKSMWCPGVSIMSSFSSSDIYFAPFRSRRFEKPLWLYLSSSFFRASGA